MTVTDASLIVRWYFVLEHQTRYMAMARVQSIADWLSEYFVSIYQY